MPLWRYLFLYLYLITLLGVATLSGVPHELSPLLSLGMTNNTTVAFLAIPYTLTDLFLDLYLRPATQLNLCHWDT